MSKRNVAEIMGLTILFVLGLMANSNAAKATTNTPEKTVVNCTGITEETRIILVKHNQRTLVATCKTGTSQHSFIWDTAYNTWGIQASSRNGDQFFGISKGKPTKITYVPRPAAVEADYPDQRFRLERMTKNQLEQQLNRH